MSVYSQSVMLRMLLLLDSTILATKVGTCILKHPVCSRWPLRHLDRPTIINICDKMEKFLNKLFKIHLLQMRNIYIYTWERFNTLIQRRVSPNINYLQICNH